MKPMAVLILMLALLSACSSEAPPPPAEPKEPVKTVLDDQLKAIDKAKAVEEIGMDHKRQIDEQLDNAD
jgi:outer membrane biogenesis lipoprotein LolB